ncbi:DUF5017 domain-containing protein [Pedobacter sp. ASV1-7]|uniref:DUF5017 domain-containing protein n=1 Tax=Pedobacter sp. ASV1-7 TaxID=3145237 RepID=UPI0032E8F8BC
MKKLKYILGALLLPAMVACQKSEPEKPTFNVTTAQQEYKIGDTVLFSIRGYADLISFYSGEPGKEYRFKDRIESDDTKLKLNISTQSLYATQRNNLSLLYSTDFKDVYTPEGIAEATWIDITSRFKLSPDEVPGTNYPVTPSGEVDIADLPVANTPIYFAFKFVGQPSATAFAGARTWRVPVFDLYNVTEDGRRTTVADVKTAGWLGIDVQNPVNKWTIQAVTPFLFFAPASTLLASEDWAVSKALLPNAAKPDVGVGIKDYLKPMKDYKYVFMQEGNYTITFVAKNVNNRGEETIIRTLNIAVKK